MNFALRGVYIQRQKNNSTKTKKKTSSEGEKIKTKVVGNGSSYCSNFYFDEIWKNLDFGKVYK